jgi:hypothetical protein
VGAAPGMAAADAVAGTAVPSRDTLGWATAMGETGCG